MQPPIFFVEPHLLGTLDATEGTHLVRDLLLGEARRLGVPIHRVVISLNITVADGGIDAKVEATPAASSLLIQGESHFQIKTGESFKPWQPAAINTELFGQGRAPTAENLGPAIRTCLERDGLYSLITMGHDLTAQQHSDAVAELQSAFRQCGFANAKAEVIGQGQLASLLQQYPSLCQRIKHQDLRCQTIQSWSSDADMQAGLALGEKQQAFIDQLTLAIVSAEIQHVRVVGEPGIGKSRLVLEAFKQSDSLAATSLYFRQATEFQRSPLFNELLKVGFDGYVIVIADECEESDRTQMWSVLKGRRHVKLITIDHGPAAPSSDPTVLTLELPALDPKETMAILQSYMPQGEGLDRWAAYCEGSARVAHAVGENLKQNPDDLLRSPSDVPVWQRFVLGYNRMDDAQARQYQTVMRHIALFHKFGFLPPVEVEGQYIAKLVQDADPAKRHLYVKRGKVSLTKACSLEAEFDKIFNNTQLFQRLESDWAGYTVTEKDIFVHPKQVWRDHLAERSDEKRLKAMVRTWSFNNLPVGLNSSEMRKVVAMRETNAFAYLQDIGSELIGRQRVLREVPGVRLASWRCPSR